MSPKPSECNLRGELRVGMDWEGVSPLQGRENFAFLARKTVSDAYILSKDYYSFEQIRACDLIVSSDKN